MELQPSFNVRSIQRMASSSAFGQECPLRFARSLAKLSSHRLSDKGSRYEFTTESYQFVAVAIPWPGPLSQPSFHLHTIAEARPAPSNTWVYDKCLSRPPRTRVCLSDRSSGES